MPDVRGGDYASDVHGRPSCSTASPEGAGRVAHVEQDAAQPDLRGRP